MMRGWIAASGDAISGMFAFRDWRTNWLRPRPADQALRKDPGGRAVMPLIAGIGVESYPPQRGSRREDSIFPPSINCADRFPIVTAARQARLRPGAPPRLSGFSR